MHARSSVGMELLFFLPAPLSGPLWGQKTSAARRLLSVSVSLSNSLFGYQSVLWNPWLRQSWKSLELSSHARFF